MAVNKVIYDGEPLIDLTADTVTAETLLAGATAHNAAGNAITGLAREITVDGALSATSANPVQNKVIMAALDAIKGAVTPITKGGTGATTSAEANSNLFDAQFRGVTSYPTKPGIYRTIGTNIFKNMNYSPGMYGMLVIFKAGYGLHLYVDGYGNLLCGYSGDTFAEPSSWKLVDRIAEQGVSGIWHYRRYVSGYAECWGSQNFSGTPSEPWGSLYMLPCRAADYPVTFSEAPVVVRDVLVNNASSCWLAAYNADTSLRNMGTFALVRPTKIGIDATVKFYVRGR